MNAVTGRHEVIVVGGGQAGLAMGYFLARQGRNFTILEAADRPAAVWRKRWESLKLFRSARYDALPGLPFPGDPGRYPSKDEVADYLTDYTRRFELPVELSSGVRATHRSGDGYLVELDDRSIEAEQVVVATGPFQEPFVPPIAEGLGPEILQMHSNSYLSPQDIPEGRVLVVGGGNTGYQIAEELSASHAVHISIGSPQKPLPQRILGRDLFWYLDKTGLIRKAKDTRIGQRLPHGDLGHWLPARPLLGRCAGVRRGWPRHARSRRDRIARPVLPRPALAAQQRLGPARLRQGRRRVLGTTDQLVQAQPVYLPLAVDRAKEYSMRTTDRFPTDIAGLPEARSRSER